MTPNAFVCQCVNNVLDGLRDGLSHFSGPSRAALIYAADPDTPMRIYDPQDLLRGHEPKFSELYLESDDWRRQAPHTRGFYHVGQVYPEKSLELAGLISYGGRSHSVLYQMWFSEHHPNMCSIGPTERWLEHAAWLLSNDCASRSDQYVGTSGYVLREYATHAVRDYIVDIMNINLGWDTPIRVYPILDAVLGISKTREEGAWPRGELIFTESRNLPKMELLTRFPATERPSLENFKHVRKLLQAVEGNRCKLVSDGDSIIGIHGGKPSRFCITADFRGGHGFLRINGDLICSFADGRFHSTTQKTKLVQVEEALLESPLDPTAGSELYKIASFLVHAAQDQKYGCTVVIDLNNASIKISGQHFEKALPLREEAYLELAQALSKVDGALHIGGDLHLHGFACLLDGRASPNEDRARGARYNSALRFTAEHPDLLVVVVSMDHPVSVIRRGVDISAQSALRPIPSCTLEPPTLRQWVAAAE